MAIPASSRRKYLKLVNRPVLFEWYDAMGCSQAWQTIEELKAETLPRMFNVSWLIHVSEDALHLASDLHEPSKTVAGTGLIPLAWVANIQELGTKCLPQSQS